jgi:hypothetical protein
LGCACLCTFGGGVIEKHVISLHVILQVRGVKRKCIMRLLCVSRESSSFFVSLKKRLSGIELG